MTVPQLRLERIPYDRKAWGAIVSGYPDSEVYHGPAWIDYLVDSQGIEPVIAEVHEDGRTVGHLVGGLVRRYGVRILGTPMSGWGTPRMGFLLQPGVDRTAAAMALLPFAYRRLGCLHVELGDAGLSLDAMAGSAYTTEVGRTFLVDIARTEDQVMAGMRATTRNLVRRGMREGLTVERAHDESFSAEFHEQLSDVFARQGLVPTYDEARVRLLIRHLLPSDEILLLRVRDADGASVATAIVVGRNRRAILWGAAFFRNRDDVHPNELLHWEIMRFWMGRGMSIYDLGGGGEYKAKYGGVETPSIRHHATRFAIVGHGRSAVRSLVRSRQVVAGRMRRTGGGAG